MWITSYISGVDHRVIQDVAISKLENRRTAPFLILSEARVATSLVGLSETN